MKPEPRGYERTPGFRSRFKVGLETPIVGRYSGLDRRLVFAPPRWYENLVLACVLGGVLLSLSGLLNLLPGVPLDGGWRLWVGAAVAFAGVWALLSNERMTCDLKARSYARREGHGPFKHVTKGSLDHLDAVVLVSEQQVLPIGSVVQYRLVLHWKGARLPLLVVGQWTLPLPAGTPLNAAAGPYLALGVRYATSLGVPFFDNSYFHSGGPLRPF